MATELAPEKAGQEILAIFRERSIRPSEMLVYANLYLAFIHKGFRDDDWRPGLTWLLEQGFIENPKTQPLSYFLTEKGFAQI